jgi:hypothetical protein
VNYFAYGSNMSAARLQARVATARPAATCRLTGHLLRFHKVGRDGSAKCDALLTGRARDVVQGVLFEVAPAEVALLDKAEDLGRGYARRTVEVIDAKGGMVKAFTYYALQIDPSLRPFSWYKQHVLAGARAAGLSPIYTRALEAVESIRDPDAARERRELAIHGLGAGHLA